MKQAKIKCPHCGKPITVREIKPQIIAAEKVEQIWAAMDEMFEMMHAQMNKLFDRSKWK